MNIADYILRTGIEAGLPRVHTPLPPKREGYSRTQALIDHIANAGPISTVALCKAFELTSRQTWGLLKQPLNDGKVQHAYGLWSQCDYYHNRKAEEAEAAALAHLTSRGWTCMPPKASS